MGEPTACVQGVRAGNAKGTTVPIYLLERLYVVLVFRTNTFPKGYFPTRMFERPI